MTSRALFEGCNASGLCNLTLGEASPMFTYTPSRDGPAAAGWNASYTGSTVYAPGTGGLGSPYRGTTLNEAGFQVSFQGTAVYLCLAMSSGVTYTLTVDSQTYSTTAPPTDGACSGYQGVQTVAYADGLSASSPQGHSVNLVVDISDSASDFSFYGGVVTLDVASAGYNISNPIYVDDSNPGWQYEGGSWIPVTGEPAGSGDYNNTHTYSCIYGSGSVAAYALPLGTAALALVGMVDVNTYAYSISLDGTTTAYNSSNLWGQPGTVMFFANVDPTVQHTIQAQNFDLNDQAGMGPNVTQCLNLDALVILTASPNSTSSTSTSSGSSGASSPTVPAASSSPSAQATVQSQLSGGAIAGIAIGVLAALALIGVAVWLLVLRKRSNRYMATGRHSPQFKADLFEVPEPTPYSITTTHPYSPSNTQALSDSGTLYHTGSDSIEMSARPPLPIITRPPKQRASRPPPSSTQSTYSQQSPPLVAQPETHAAPVAPAMEHASTFDLIQILNSRLHNEQLDNIEEPPLYETR